MKIQHATLRVLLGSAVLALAHSSTARGDERTKILFRNAAPATVSVETQPDAEGNISLGSGSLIDAAGVVLTNHHVVESSLAGDRRVRVRLFDGREFWGRVTVADEEIDLALVHLVDSPGGLPVLALGDSDLVEVGDDCFAIGNPDGLSWSLSTGIISGKRADLLQTTTPLNPGNSGGPLLDMEARIIGVNTYSMYEDRQNIAFSRAANVVRGWLEKVLGGAAAPPSPPVREVTEELDLSFLPPARWQPIPSREAGVRFAFQAPAASNGRSPAFLQVKEIERRDYDSLASLVADVKSAYTETHGRVDVRIETIFDYAGGAENAAYLEVAYSRGANSLVESNFLVLGADSIHVFKFVSLASAWADFSAAASEMFRSVQWKGEGGGTDPRFGTPERATQVMIDAIRTSDVELFFQTVHPVLFFDRETGGKFSGMDEHGREGVLAGVRERYADLLAKGSLLPEVERGVAVLPGARTDGGATLRLVTTAENGDKETREVELASSPAGWKLVGIGAPEPYDPEAVPRTGEAVKTKTYRHAQGAFAIDIPLDWLVLEGDQNEGTQPFTFAPPDSVVDENLTRRISIIVVARPEFEATQSMPPAQLSQIKEGFLAGMKDQYQAKWEVTREENSTLAGRDALVLEYKGARTPIAPVVQGRITLTFHAGVLYAIQLESQDPAESPPLELALGTIRIPG